MLQLLRTSSENVDFRALVVLLDQYLRVLDGDDHAFYAQFNQITNIKHAVVAYADGQPVGCGAFKEYEPGTVEIKRMFVRPERRGQGIAQAVLRELEQWAQQEGYNSCVLETGKRQPEAIRLYEKSGYAHISNFGQYAGDDNSVCLQKSIAVS
ncbi:GNAT family N-acetyltransferase [Hymenobacter sp. ASUV-10]|uniref:GNAT family N-acetyltransferase n=1 Tax=Hymenobacter aranciens TaxID=3063996 RepID=A0ABT9B4N0_9BACT|nr:GNAT family N-acetyltransferase [Hymenobacter sp. ASUV-10]MDO7873122.1 GNAT family N-acetyltransferase [Hymenobacter sp. ASUV-10]